MSSTFLFVYFIMLHSFVKAAKKVRSPYLQPGVFPHHTFIPIPGVSDEFHRRGTFNHLKWYDKNERWLGRQPGIFSSSNVRQRNGKLRLTGKYEDKDSVFSKAPSGYSNFTTAFVMTKRRIRYGFIEVSAKPGKSKLSSAFWASLDTPTRWTEIDVFELGGGANPPHDYRVYTNVHVFRDMKKGIDLGLNKISRPKFYEISEPLRNKFHVYALDWNKKYITWLFDGKPIRRIRNTHWKQALPFKLDVETMPYWFGLPSRDSLPTSFRIRYIRAWSRIKMNINNQAERKNEVSLAKNLHKSKTSKKSQKIKCRKEKRELSDNVSRNKTSTFRSTSSGVVNSFHDFNLQFHHNSLDDNMLKIRKVQIEQLITELENQNYIDDDAVMELKHGLGTESKVRPETLQRAPTVGSNEVIYEPVKPPKGSSWAAEIEKLNKRIKSLFS